MAGAKGAGTAHLKANLEKVSGDAAGQQQQANPGRRASDPRPPRKGVSVERVKHQAHRDAEAEDVVRVLDHDDNAVLFSGSRQQFNRLKKAIQGEEGE